MERLSKNNWQLKKPLLMLELTFIENSTRSKFLCSLWRQEKLFFIRRSRLRRWRLAIDWCCIAWLVFHFLWSGWKHLGYSNHRGKKKITNYNKLVYPFPGNSRSGCYLWTFSGVHDWQCNCGYVQKWCSLNIHFFANVSVTCLTAMTGERYSAVVRPLKHVRFLTTTDIRYDSNYMGNSISFCHFQTHGLSSQQ